jgi:nitrate reductase NapE component
MNKFFDYIFYRVYKQYERWREDYPYPFAEGVVVVIQGFIVLSILAMLSSHNVLPRKVLYLINHLRYKKKYIEIIQDYDAKVDKNRKRNGFLIVLLIVVVVLFPIVIGILRNNFGYDI